ncbi:MAG: hypothetical protein Q9190_002676 [Brigantiaea leucoxantha]
MSSLYTQPIKESKQTSDCSIMAATQNKPAKLFADVKLEHGRLKAAWQQFAIRSRGHTQWEGANNIQDGVTIDLMFLKGVKLDEAIETIDIGPGARWKEVYVELKKTGRIVAGGRNGTVGVGGFLLGRGNTFFTGQRGFACDDVISYEVVVADSSIIVADKDNNSDLFMALKEFTADFSEDVNSMLLLFLAYSANNHRHHRIRVRSDVKRLLVCPLSSFIHPKSKRNILLTEIHHVYSNCFFTATVKNDIRVFRKAASLHDGIVEELKSFIPDGHFITECLFQPLPTALGQKSKEFGGNVIGATELQHDSVIFTAIAIVKTREQEQFTYPRLKA